VAEQLTPPHRAGWQGLPAAARIGILYLAARIVTTGFFLAAAEISGPGSRFGPEATIGDLAMGWDAAWYWLVAEAGYPTELPREGGLVAENAWAFMPVYPYLAAALGTVLGSWPAAAVTISVVAGYGASLVLYRMLRLRLDRGAATWAVVFFAAGPLAALFQVGYAESLFLFWLFLALLQVMRRRYLWLYLLIPVMGFTRPGILAFSLFLALYGIWRWFRRRTEALPAREVVHIVLLGLLAAAVGFSWQVIAAVVTGEPGAYLETELSWRRIWLPGSDAHFLPFDGFLVGTRFWADVLGWPHLLGYAALALLLIAVAAALWLPQVRRLGVEIRLWSVAYLVYLLAVFFPQSSTLRLLFPLSPLAGAFAVPRSTTWRFVVLLAALGAQWWWIYNMYAQANTFLRVP